MDGDLLFTQSNAYRFAQEEETDLWVGGGIHNGNNLFFKGAIDEFRIYNRVVTDAEVIRIYEMPTCSQADTSGNDQDRRFGVYPNPSFGPLQLFVPKDEIPEVEVYNSIGQQLYITLEQVGPELYLIHTHDWATAVYFFRVRVGDLEKVYNVLIVK